MSNIDVSNIGAFKDSGNLCRMLHVTGSYILDFGFLLKVSHNHYN